MFSVRAMMMKVWIAVEFIYSGREYSVAIIAELIKIGEIEVFDKKYYDNEN